MEILELIKYNNQNKSSMDRLNSRTEGTEESVGELENLRQKSFNLNREKTDWGKKKMKRASGTHETIIKDLTWGEDSKKKRSNIHIIGVSGEEKHGKIE